MVLTKLTDTKAEMIEGGPCPPDRCRPWEDRTLSPEERYQSYYAVARAKVQEIRDAGTRPGVTEAERRRIRLDPEVNFWVTELRQLKGESPEAFCARLDRPAVCRELLEKNYLGAEAWLAQGIDVGAEPPLPGAVTEALLNSECPFLPGEKIKDTHLLVLVPKTVNGDPYSAVKLGELCATRKGAGEKLIHDRSDLLNHWKGQPWASLPQAKSEWLLLPKGEPDPEGPSERHFRTKTIAEQELVHRAHYPEYREVKTVELMTALLLNDMANNEVLALWLLRCQEPTRTGARVCVGSDVHGPFGVENHGLNISTDHGDNGFVYLGRALARKL